MKNIDTQTVNSDKKQLIDINHFKKLKKIEKNRYLIGYIIGILYAELESGATKIDSVYQILSSGGKALADSEINKLNTKK